MENSTQRKISRRSVMQALSFAIISAPAMLRSRSALAAKMSKAAAAYQNSPKGSQTCANCKLFVPPSSCTIVEGPISPKGWCKFWVGK
jgi:High potential iron-sulfur protein